MNVVNFLSLAWIGTCQYPLDRSKLAKCVAFAGTFLQQSSVLVSGYVGLWTHSFTPLRSHTNLGQSEFGFLTKKPSDIVGGISSALNLSIMS